MFYLTTDRVSHLRILCIECNQTIVSIVDTDSLVDCRQDFGYELGAKADDGCKPPSSSIELYTEIANSVFSFFNSYHGFYDVT